MINVIKKILELLKLIWDCILNIILFIFYIFLFLPYKIFKFKDKEIKWWIRADKYDLDNKNLPF